MQDKNVTQDSIAPPEAVPIIICANASYVTLIANIAKDAMQASRVSQVELESTNAMQMHRIKPRFNRIPLSMETAAISC